MWTGRLEFFSVGRVGVVLRFSVLENVGQFDLGRGARSIGVR